MKQIKAIFSGLTFIGILTVTINCLAVTTDSTHIRRPTIVPAQREVVLAEEKKCVWTEEAPYKVTITDHKSVYPSCPPNMVIKRLDFRTAAWLEVTTYVRARCCPHELKWSEGPKEEAQT